MSSNDLLLKHSSQKFQNINLLITDLFRTPIFIISLMIDIFAVHREHVIESQLKPINYLYFGDEL